MDDNQQFCLRWDNHQSTLISVFATLLEHGTLVDCTLAAEGKFLRAHKVVLSACSPYFAALLSQQYDQHPVFILKDVKFEELCAIVDYMYRGEVNIPQDQLAALLRTAEALQIKGLPLQLSVPDLTIENEKPLKAELCDSDWSGSREASTSPTLRKRRRIRRRSINSNDESKSQLVKHESHTDDEERSGTDQGDALYDRNSDDDIDEPQNKRQALGSVSSDSQDDEAINQSELLIEPKNEYDDGQDETVVEELLDDLDQRGPHHVEEAKLEPAESTVGGQHPDGQDFIEVLQPKVVTMEDGSARYLCPQCGVKYKKLSALRSHMKECGKGAKCPLCPKIVTQRRNLAKHMERHRQEKGDMEL